MQIYAREMTILNQRWSRDNFTGSLVLQLGYLDKLAAKRKVSSTWESEKMTANEQTTAMWNGKEI